MKADAVLFYILSIFVAGTEGNILTVPVHHKYHYVAKLLTWPEAQSYCRSHYVDIATVDTMEEHQAIFDIIPNQQSAVVWLGLKRSAVKSWGWSDGSRVEDWASGRIVSPSSGGDCVWMSPEGNWNIGDCNEQRPSLCYRSENGAESYSLNLVLSTWKDAQTFCRNSFTDLVTVKTPDQIQGLLWTLGGSSVWIGLFRDEWVWSDQSPRAFRLWDEWNPNGEAHQHCTSLRMQFRSWDTLECETLLHFICHTVSPIIKAVFNIKLASKVPISAVQLSLQQQIQKLLKGDNIQVTLRRTTKQQEPVI